MSDGSLFSLRSCTRYGMGQIGHVRLRLGADKGEHELARSGLTVAPRLGERVLRGAGDRESLDVSVATERFPLVQLEAQRGSAATLRVAPGVAATIEVVGADGARVADVEPITDT